MPPEPVSARRVEVSADRLPGWIDRFGERHGGIVAAWPGAGREVVRLESGDGSWAEVDVPWPPLDAGAAGQPLQVLLEHVAGPRRLALLLVRKGGFGIGVLDAAGLTRTKVGSRHVQGRTKAGGWSQQRYARRRAQQSRAAYAAAADEAARLLVPVVETLDGLVPGGDRAAVAEVLEDTRLRPLVDLPRGRFLAVPDPRRRVLEQAARDATGVVVRVADVTR